MKYKLNSYICVICQKPRKATHLKSSHNLTINEYYNLYFKKEDEGYCKLCNKQTKFISFIKGYAPYCSSSCAGKVNIKKSLKTIKIKYNVQNISQLTAIKNKKVENLKTNYNVINPSQLLWVKKKKIISSLKRYGTANISGAIEVKEKKRQSSIHKYGVENISQSPIIQQKKINSCFKRKLYTLPSKKQINLLGYEPQFLDYVFTNKLLNENEIVYQPKPIKYIDFNNKSRVYFPDFYIPKLNLIVEIKSTWSQINDKFIICKENAVIASGYNYIRIVDHNFSKFTKLFISST